MEGFVEVEAEVGEDDPQLLPPVGVLKLPDGNDGDIERYYELIMMMGLKDMMVFKDMMGLKDIMMMIIMTLKDMKMLIMTLN